MARESKLSPKRKAFINSLLEDYQPNDAKDVQEMFKNLPQGTLEGMSVADKYDHWAIPNSMIIRTKKRIGNAWNWNQTLKQLRICFGNRVSKKDIYHSILSVVISSILYFPKYGLIWFTTILRYWLYVDSFTAFCLL